VRQLLYEMVTGGREPFENEGLMTVGAKVLSGETLEQYLPRTGGDRTLRELMRVCWAFKPEDRPSMTMVCSALQSHYDRLAAGIPTEASAATASLTSADSLLMSDERCAWQQRWCIVC